MDIFWNRTIKASETRWMHVYFLFFSPHNLSVYLDPGIVSPSLKLFFKTRLSSAVSTKAEKHLSCLYKLSKFTLLPKDAAAARTD